VRRGGGGRGPRADRLNDFVSDDVQTFAFSTAAGHAFNWRSFLLTPAAIVRGGSREPTAR